LPEAVAAQSARYHIGSLVARSALCALPFGLLRSERPAAELQAFSSACSSLTRALVDMAAEI